MGTPVNLKLGVASRDGITIQTAAGTFRTGLTDGSFTKKLTKNGTGNQSVTGITVSEPDGTNNAGQYSIALATTSGIVSAVGSYHLLIYETADPTYSWDQVFQVTQDGFPGSVGSLTFTASANDGRVEDDTGTPLENATVYLSKAGGYLVSFQTDSNGLWGPAYFDASFGTVTITVVKSGYSVGAGALTVGASSVTGPGTDIALDVVSTGASVSASELWSFARRQADNKPGALADLKIKQLVNDALDRLAMDMERAGSWYIRRGYLQVEAPVNVTVTLAQGATTCALVSGSFPTWSGDGRLYFSSQPVIDIASRTDANNLVLSAPWGGASGDYSGTLFLDNYPLESNSFEFMGVLNGQTWPYAANALSIEKLWELQNDWANFSQRGALGYAVANNRMHLWPYPSQDAQVAYIYRARPLPLDDESDIADVDPTWISALRHLIAYYVAFYFGSAVAGPAEKCLELYTQAKDRLVANAKTPSGIGNRQRGTRRDYWHSQGWGQQ